MTKKKRKHGYQDEGGTCLKYVDSWEAGGPGNGTGSVPGNGVFRKKKHWKLSLSLNNRDVGVPKAPRSNGKEFNVYVGLKKHDLEGFKSLIKDYYQKFEASGRTQIPPNWHTIVNFPLVKFSTLRPFRKYAKEALFEVLNSVEKSEKAYKLLWGKSRHRLSLNKISNIEHRIEQEVDKFKQDNLYSPTPISKIADELGTTYNTIHKYAQTIAANSYSQMWPTSERIADYKLISIIERINQEVEKYKRGGSPVSLRQIGIEFDVSSSVILKYARKVAGDFYSEMWPSPEKLSEENDLIVKERINQEVKKYKLGDSIVPPPIKQIAKELGISEWAIYSRAKAIAGNLYSEMWSYGLTGKKTSAVKKRIQKEIEKYEQGGSPSSLSQIAFELGVSINVVMKHAKDKAGILYSEIWYTTDFSAKKVVDIEEKIEQEVNKFVKSSGTYSPPSLNQIANDLDISYSAIQNRAKDIAGNLYSEMWSYGLTNGQVSVIHERMRREVEKYKRGDCPATMSQIANELGVSDVAISYYFKEKLIEIYGEEIGIELYVNIWLENDYVWRYVGAQVHKILQSVLTMFFNSIDIKYFSEIPVFLTTQIDGLLLNDVIFPGKFKDNKLFELLFRNNISRDLGLHKMNFNTIKALTIDYTFDSSRRNLLDKIEKYQDSEMLFMIVMLNQHRDKIKSPPHHKKVLFSDNLLILGVEKFFDLIELSERYRDYFANIFDLADDLKLKELLLEPLLKRSRRYGKQELREDLKKFGLIKKKISEFFAPSSQIFRNMNFYL
ncbi:MAG: hypothetical protein ACFFAS_01215 [Promethearchaeota archaeon]